MRAELASLNDCAVPFSSRDQPSDFAGTICICIYLYLYAAFNGSYRYATCSNYTECQYNDSLNIGNGICSIEIFLTEHVLIRSKYITQCS